MFIVSQCGCYCELVNKIYYKICYDRKTQEVLEEIYDRRMRKVYNYGSTSKCEYEIKREQENYIKNNNIKEKFRLFVNNGTCYAEYEDVKFGHLIFNFIKNSIADNISLVDLSKEQLLYINITKRYNIITLCGSTRFKDDFIEQQKKLTLEGNIVLSVGLFGHSGDCEVWEGMSENTETDIKIMLDDMHKVKIDMADEIFVINKDGYIGESTEAEIEYARSRGKKITYMEQNILKYY